MYTFGMSCVVNVDVDFVDVDVDVVALVNISSASFVNGFGCALAHASIA